MSVATMSRQTKKAYLRLCLAPEAEKKNLGSKELIQQRNISHYID